MKIAPVLAASLVLGLVACSSSNTPAPEQDKGLEGDGVAAADTAPDKNPDGVPYPTDNIGTIERKGEKPGNRIQNFKFLGYPEGNVSAGLQPISLAQYFDPSGNKTKILHIQASGSWCVYCQQEAKIVAPMRADLEAKKVVWIITLAEGATPGTPSKQSDLDKWLKTYTSTYTHALDPGNKNLGPFYDASALPWNADIDATTMEILKAGTGAVTSKEGILQEIDEALDLAQKSTLRNPQ